MTIPTVGYQGFKSNYRQPTVATYHRKQPQFNLNALKPRLPPSASGSVLPTITNAESTTPYESLQTLQDASGVQISEGFQKSLAGAMRSSSTIDHDVKNIPVVGYTGHRMGNRA